MLLLLCVNESILHSSLNTFLYSEVHIQHINIYNYFYKFYENIYHAFNGTVFLTLQIQLLC